MMNLSLGKRDYQILSVVGILLLAAGAVYWLGRPGAALGILTVAVLLQCAALLVVARRAEARVSSLVYRELDWVSRNVDAVMLDVVRSGLKQPLEALNSPQTVVVVGRGHSGTRAMTKMLVDSGVYMGEPLNDAGDLFPYHYIYEAARVCSKHVRSTGEHNWDFSELHQAPIDPYFESLLGFHLSSLLMSSGAMNGWKFPETILIYPWLVRLLPEARYIFWVRDPRDSILGGHYTDDLARFGIPFASNSDTLRTRAASWKYQYDIVKATPEPKRFIRIRFEDFILDHQHSISRLTEFLGIPLKEIPVYPQRVGVWKRSRVYKEVDFLRDPIRELGYEPDQAGKSS